MIVEYFNILYKTEGCSSEDVLACIQSSITYDQNMMLLAIFSDIEVKDALFEMYPDKSPGPDGMNPTFYQKFWHIVGEDVVQAYLKLH